MKNINTEIRHVQGRTVRVERIDMAEHPILNDTTIHWSVSVLGTAGWAHLINYTYAMPEEKKVNMFEYCFDEAGAVL